MQRTNFLNKLSYLIFQESTCLDQRQEDKSKVNTSSSKSHIESIETCNKTETYNNEGYNLDEKNESNAQLQNVVIIDNHHSNQIKDINNAITTTRDNNDNDFKNFENEDFRTTDETALEKKNNINIDSQTSNYILHKQGINYVNDEATEKVVKSLVSVENEKVNKYPINQITSEYEREQKIILDPYKENCEFNNQINSQYLCLEKQAFDIFDNPTETKDKINKDSIQEYNLIGSNEKTLNINYTKDLKLSQSNIDKGLKYDINEANEDQEQSLKKIINEDTLSPDNEKAKVLEEKRKEIYTKLGCNVLSNEDFLKKNHKFRNSELEICQKVNIKRLVRLLDARMKGLNIEDEIDDAKKEENNNNNNKDDLLENKNIIDSVEMIGVNINAKANKKKPTLKRFSLV